MRGYNRRVDMITGSPTRKIDLLREKLAREGRDVILLSTGQPGYPPPIELRRWLAEALMEESTRLYSYTPTQGIIDLREAIVEDIARFGGPRYSADSVVVTAGGQEAMFIALSTILEPGDEVVLLDPTYFGYKPIIEYLGGRATWVRAPLDWGFQPVEEELKEAVKRGRTKAIVVVTPDNPTGRLLSLESSRLIADLAVDYDLWILVDEAYRTLILEGDHVWIAKMAPDHTIGINTFSKDPGIPGWRLGYLYAPEWIASKARLVSEEVIYCPSSIAQRAIAWYLSNEKVRTSHVERAREFLRVRRDAALEAIDRYLPNARYVKPLGSMFVYVDLSRYLRGAGVNGVEELARILLEEKQVAVIPGGYFGSTTRAGIRVSFATESPERIREGIKRISEAVSSRL